MSQPCKPKIVQDIQPHARRSVFKAHSRALVNLSYARSSRRMPWKRMTRLGFGMAGVLFLVIGSVSAPTSQTFAQVSVEERAQLEAELKRLEAEANAAETQRRIYSQQKNTLKSEVGKLDSNIASLNAQIKAINTSLTQLNNKIGTTESQIEVTSESLSENRVLLADLMQDMYESDQTSLVEIFLKNKQISDFFTNANNVAVLQDNVRATIGKISSLKGQLEDHKNELTLAKTGVEENKRYQTAQKSRVDQVKQEKTQLLKVTQGQESKYQALYAEKKAAADRVRTKLFELLGGGEIQFGQAYQYAKVAGDGTGVRPALILAVLNRESALGRNVGRCDYEGAMHPTRDIPVFLEIMKELNMDPHSVKVSCAILSDGAYGGAMGPAQFIPSTWKMYASRIASVTGNNPPSPWRNVDAFTATALYLKDAGAAAGGAAAERAAAAKYYAGGNWQSYLWSYGDSAVQEAQRMQDQIDILLGAD